MVKVWKRWLAIGALPLLSIGCSMRVPVDGLDFTPEEKVILTFQDGTQIRGRVDNGESVQYITDESDIRGTVESVDEQEIVVADLVKLSDHGTSTFQKERLEHFRLYVGEEDLDRLILSRDEILQVERVVPDKSRTLKRVVFWSFGVGIALLAVRDRNF
jgi:hypothetical protein